MPKFNANLTPEQRLSRAHEQAIYDLASKLVKRGRKPEGALDDAGVWSPSALEHFDLSKRIKHSSRSYSTFPHIYWLMHRAVKDEPVPADIAAFVKAEWPRIHERAMVEAVEKNLATAAAREALTRKEQLQEEKDAAAKSTVGRLAARRSQLAGLENSRKKLESKLKAISTRIKKVKASVRALERNAAK